MIERRYRVLLRRVYLYRVVMIGVPFLLTYAGMMLFALFYILIFIFRGTNFSDFGDNIK